MNSNSINSFFKFADRKNLPVIKRWVYINYYDLFEQSKTIAGFLASRHIKKNDYVPVLFEDQFYFIKTIIGLWYLGAIPVVINSNLLEKENSIFEENN